MAKAKKLLVPFDPQKPNWNPNDWLLPVLQSDKVELMSLRTGVIFQFGRVVFVGQLVTENDLFAKLVDSGRKVPNVANALDVLVKYLDAMNSVKIGNVVEVSSRGAGDMALLVASATPSGFPKPAT